MCIPQRGAHMGLGPWGIERSPWALHLCKKSAPSLNPFHLHLGPTTLTVYGQFGWVCSRSNDLVHLDEYKTQGACEIQGGLCVWSSWIDDQVGHGPRVQDVHRAHWITIHTHTGECYTTPEHFLRENASLG